MTEVTYIRHLRQTSHNSADAPLVSGQQVTSKEYDYVLCSPYLRCRQTLQLYNYEPDVDVRLCEYEGAKNLKTFKLHPSTLNSLPRGITPPGPSETWEQCASRIDSVMTDIERLGGRVLVVTHGIVVRYAQQKLCGSSPYRRGRDVPYGGGFTALL